MAPLPLPPGAGTAAWLAGTATTEGGGWFYNLLTRSGVSPSTAHTVVDYVVRPLAILLVVLVAALVAHVGARIIRRLLDKVARRADGRSASPRAGARVATLASLSANAWRFFVAVLAVAIILGMLGVNLTPLLASATIIGATLGFGAQALIRDYLSGFLLTVEDQFGIGDSISVNEVSGVVEDVTLRVTRVRSPDGTVWYVPNGDIRRLANTSRGWAKAVLDLTLTLTPELDLPAVQRVLGEVAREVAARPRFSPTVSEPPEMLGVVAADATTCTLRVRVRTSPALRDALTEALREEAIDRLLRDGLLVAPPAEESSAT